MVAVVVAVARRPHLWVTAVRTGWSMLPDRWWARGLAGLRPDPRWLQFRQETAYGGDGLNAIKPDDLVDFLEWRRTFPSG